MWVRVYQIRCKYRSIYERIYVWGRYEKEQEDNILFLHLGIMLIDIAHH